MTRKSTERRNVGARRPRPRGIAFLCLVPFLFACSPAPKVEKKTAAPRSPAMAETAKPNPTPLADAAAAAKPLEPERATSSQATASQATSSQMTMQPPAKPQGGDHHLVFQASPLALSGSRVFGPASAGGPLAPDDFAIGPLADSRPESLDEAAALAAASAFLDGIVKGSYREDLALPERKPLLALLAAPLLKEPRPASYRIGRLKIGQDAAEGEEVAACRLRIDTPRREAGTDAGSSVSLSPEMRTGEISLRLEGKTWYVESILLDETKASNDSPFEPGFDEE